MMTPSIITPPPGKIIYTKVDLGEQPIENGSVKLVDPATLDEVTLGDGMIRSKAQNGRVAWAKKDGADWDIVISDADGSNPSDAGQIDSDERQLYGDVPVLSPSLDKVAFTVTEVRTMDGVDYNRWQSYIHELGGNEYLTDDIMYEDLDGKQMGGMEREVMPTFSPSGDWLLDFIYVGTGNGQTFWLYLDTVAPFALTQTSGRGWHWYFEGQENGDGFNAQEYGLMQAQWAPNATQEEGAAAFSISNKVFYCTYNRMAGMSWDEIGSGAWPDFSSDGSKIAYATLSGDIQVYSTDTKDILQTLSPTASNYFAYPQWSSDGTMILCTMFEEAFNESENKFTSTGRLVLIDVESSSIIEVNQDPAYRGYWVE